jgi:hypothetical protein
MRTLTPFEFVPDHQPYEGEVVKFTLRPLDFQGQCEMRRAVAVGGGVPTFEGLLLASKHITGWVGVKKDSEALSYSRAAMHDILHGGTNGDWAWWMGEISSELFRNAELSEIERKN